MKYAVLIVSISALGVAMTVANPKQKRTNTHYTQQTVETLTPAAQMDPVNALHAPVGPTDGDYGNVPVW